MKVTITFILALMFSWTSTAQIEFDSIIQDYKNHQLQRMDTLTKLTKSKTGTAWLSLLPSVNYDIDNSSVNIGISLSNFSNYHQQKQRNLIEIQKLKESMKNQMDNELVRLENDYLKLIFEMQNLETEVNSLKLKTELFELKKSQFEHTKINLESYLKIKQTYHNALLNIDGSLDGLIIKIKNFQNRIKSQSKLSQEFQVMTLKEKLDVLMNNIETKEDEE
ncbi:hypothetical protein JBL43_05260 [Aureibaculum sp. A20]|uniref:Uncharacterized protein n=1 Tax=Aureibaculum flavum TaxID=2795986 RepID=A0ABS0WNT0_9FLAO|nr:hypothetical protein [Aureibaculum flavum]MBJ2173635.1 hypothetical protein [Aureibaculum flavum]